MPPGDGHLCGHVLRTLHQLDLPMRRYTVQAMSIPSQFGMAPHGGRLSFGMLTLKSKSPARWCGS